MEKCLVCGELKETGYDIDAYGVCNACREQVQFDWGDPASGGGGCDPGHDGPAGPPGELEPAPAPSKVNLPFGR